MIHSLQVRTIFSLFVLKKHMLGFAQIISVFHTGWRFARVGVGYPVAVRRSVNGGLVHVCFSVTKKRRGDTYKAKEGKWGRMPR